MKPVAIFRFSADDGPGYFASFLDTHAIPWKLFCLDEGDAIPEDLQAFSGLVLMGGAMSANDPLPWIPAVLERIRQARQANLPCLGHCLGGQLMSKALGGVVTVNPVKEIGWQPVFFDDNGMAREWLGELAAQANQGVVFQWHGEAFSLPPGSTRILGGDACGNQAFVIGNSLGMQCHTEMTPEMIEQWCGDWAAEQADPSLPSIQTPEQIRLGMQANLARMRRLSERLYSRWLAGLDRDG